MKIWGAKGEGRRGKKRQEGMTRIFKNIKYIYIFLEKRKKQERRAGKFLSLQRIQGTRIPLQFFQVVADHARQPPLIFSSIYGAL